MKMIMRLKRINKKWFARQKKVKIENIMKMMKMRIINNRRTKMISQSLPTVMEEFQISL
jgi:hypothetical protein